MKRFILPLVAMAIASLSLVGCGNDDVRAVVLTKYYTVKPADWQPQYSNNGDGTGSIAYYYAPCGNADLDMEAFQHGAITAYLCTDEGDKPLPYTVYNASDENGDGLLDTYWEEHFSYDIQNGGVTFIMEANDFRPDMTLDHIGTLQFKVAVVRNF